MLPDIGNISDILKQAGQGILLPAFMQQSQSHIKADGSIVTETDVACQNYLQEKLHALAPDIAFLGEEMSESEQLQALQSSTPFWCVDPLDGTSNFATPMPLFAISVALIQHGKPVLACIHDPVRQETFTAVRHQGFALNGQAIHHQYDKTLKESVGFLDFKRLPAKLATIFATQSIYRSQRNIGSCALEWAWLAAGRGQFIVHGGEKLWDYAAGSLLAEEAGYQVSDFSGAAIFEQASLSSSILAAPLKIHQALKQHLSI